ncbi:MAG TPA: hypothetical protein VHR66_23000 [Gemmataceae bacterium]|jgi:outer membrane murein-binding lipoprotein Lpp|nr:hypothetical protein [Gemmataceae bacterium]
MIRILSLFAVVIIVAGCDQSKSVPMPKANADTIKANLDQLPAEDRALAEQQKLCAESDQELGSMGVPIKVMVKGEPVFVCCKGCENGVQKDPDKTLAKVKALKEKNK